jgi:hypothetical protein
MLLRRRQLCFQLDDSSHQSLALWTSCPRIALCHDRGKLPNSQKSEKTGFEAVNDYPRNIGRRSGPGAQKAHKGDRVH